MKQFCVCAMFMIFAMSGVACQPDNVQSREIPSAPQSWIDAPLDGSAFSLNPLEVISHSTDPFRIAQVELSVNGAIVQSSPNSDNTVPLVTTKQTWTPPGPGNYIVMVRAQNSAGVWGEYAQVVITIQGTSAPPQSSPVAPPPFVVPSSTPITRPGVPTLSPVPAASITFYADATTLTQGQCATIRWQVTNVSQIFLDNATVNLTGSKQDCPIQTTSHTLRIVTLDNQSVQRTLTINVQTPSRTFTPIPRSTPTSTRTSTPLPPAGCSGTPVISSFSASPSTINAGGSSVLSWGAVSNADSVEIDNGIGGVPAPSLTTVSPRVTIIYLLTARCKGATVTARTIVTVVQPPTPTLVLRQLPTTTPTRTPIIPR